MQACRIRVNVLFDIVVCFLFDIVFGGYDGWNTYGV